MSTLKPCPGCRNLVRANEEFCPYCARRLRAENGVGGWYRKLRVKIRNSPFIATQIIIGIIALMFLVQFIADLALPKEFHDTQRATGLFSLGIVNSLTYVRLGSNFHPYVLFFHQYWRFLTSCFLHFGILHVLFNSYAFWNLGRLAERLWGSRQVFATFILTGVVGSAVSFGWHVLATNPVNSAGASGAICGVLGLLLGAFYRNKYHVGERLGSELVKWAVYILVFGLVAGADNAAHIGGMLSGAVLGYLLPPTTHSKNPGREMKIWYGLAVLALIVLLVGFGFMIEFYLQGPELAEWRPRRLR